MQLEYHYTVYHCTSLTTSFLIDVLHSAQVYPLTMSRRSSFKDGFPWRTLEKLPFSLNITVEPLLTKMKINTLWWCLWFENLYIFKSMKIGYLCFEKYQIVFHWKLPVLKCWKYIYLLNNFILHVNAYFFSNYFFLLFWDIRYIHVCNYVYARTVSTYMYVIMYTLVLYLYVLYCV